MRTMPIIKARSRRQSHSIARERAYARLNWNAHVVPLVESRARALIAELTEAGEDAPYIDGLAEHGRMLRCLWAIVEDDPEQLMKQNEDQKEAWTDSLQVDFGSRPLPLRAVVPVKGRTRVVAERRAVLLFSQLPSGAVAILLFPPSSEVAKPEPVSYLVRLLDDPRNLTEGMVNGFLRQLYTLDRTCSAVSLRSRAAKRCLRGLAARDAATRGKGPAPWLVKWLWATVKLLAKQLVRAHSPIPH
jgi:hypothetical protein